MFKVFESEHRPYNNLVQYTHPDTERGNVSTNGDDQMLKQGDISVVTQRVTVRQPVTPGVWQCVNDRRWEYRSGSVSALTRSEVIDA